MDLNIHQQVLGSAFAIGAVVGAVANKTCFCTMGAVADWINSDSTARLRAWLMAIAVAMIGLVALETAGLVSLGETSFPPYRSTNFAWLRHILGGLIFGAGMTLASGCGNKILVRLGAGNLKSLVVLVIAGLVAWAMMWTDLYKLAFDPWLSPLTINLARFGIASQTLDGILGGIAGLQDTRMLHLGLGLAIGAALAVYAFRSEEFRSDPDHLLGAVVMGGAVVAAWAVTGGKMGQDWRDWAEMADTMPSRVMVQSMTFISPMGDSVRLLMNGREPSLVNFGICCMAGVVAGAFFHAFMTHTFRVEWFPDQKDFLAHALGAVLMGLGGVLAMGCSIGQGITGVSSLALGSFITLVSIIAGSALTMKLRYRAL